MAQRKKRGKNPGLFTPRNIAIAAGAGIGVWLLVRELRKRGMLGGNGDGYATKPKPVDKPKPKPVYKSSVVQTIQSAQKFIPAATSGPMYGVYRALTNVRLQEKARPQAEAQITKATADLNAALAKHRANLSRPLTPAQRDLAMKAMTQDQERGEANIAAAKRAFESSNFQQNLNQQYDELRRATKEALASEQSLRSQFGDKADPALNQLRAALIDAGDPYEEVATSEGSVERSQ